MLALFLHPEYTVDDLADGALKLGIRFNRYSHWPVAWHPIVMRVLQEAARVGVQTLYVKEKLGGLKIQGGSEDLAEAVVRAMSEADQTCVVCGEHCNRQNAPSLPVCPSCGTDGWEGTIKWVEPTTL